MLSSLLPGPGDPSKRSAPIRLTCAHAISAPDMNAQISSPSAFGELHVRAHVVGIRRQWELCLVMGFGKHFASLHQDFHNFLSIRRVSDTTALEWHTLQLRDRHLCARVGAGVEQSSRGDRRTHASSGVRISLASSVVGIGRPGHHDVYWELKFSSGVASSFQFLALPKNSLYRIRL